MKNPFQIAKGSASTSHQQHSFSSWRRGLATAVCMGSFALGMAAPAAAQVAEYPLPNPLSAPCEIEFDSKGMAWIEEVTGNAITRFDPATGAFKRFPLAQPAAVPGGMEFGPDGGLWFPQIAANVITRLDPSTGSMQSYPMPYGTIISGPLSIGIAAASDMAAGKDNGMWFTMSGTNAVGRIDIASKQIEIIPVAGPLSTVVVVTQIVQRGPRNTMVMSLGEANKIITIDVFTRQITEYPMPTPASLPQGVTTDRNGDIWFTESAGQKFGRIEVNTGQITEYDILALRKQFLPLSLGNPLPFPGPIRQGSDGKIYFAEGGFEGGNKIGQFDPATGAFKEIVVPTPLAGICDINSSQPGAIWFGELTGNKLGKLKF